MKEIIEDLNKLRYYINGVEIQYCKHVTYGGKCHIRRKPKEENTKSKNGFSTVEGYKINT